KAGQELLTYGKTGEMGEYMSWAMKSGTSMFQNTWSRQELQNVAMQVTADSVNRKNIKNVLEDFHRGIANVYDGVRDRGIRVFSFNERMFKMTTFIDRFDNLRTAYLRRTGKVADEELMLDFAKQAAA